MLIADPERVGLHTFTSTHFTNLEEPPEEFQELRRSILETDGPRHLALRKLLMRDFSPAQLRRYEDFLRGLADADGRDGAAAGGDGLRRRDRGRLPDRGAGPAARHPRGDDPAADRVGQRDRRLLRPRVRPRAGELRGVTEVPPPAVQLAGVAGDLRVRPHAGRRAPRRRRRRPGQQAGQPAPRGRRPARRRSTSTTTSCCSSWPATRPPARRSATR